MLIIIAVLAGLMFFAYRGVSILILTPLLAAIAALGSGLPVLASYTQIFMPATGHFITVYFPLFLLGAIFGKLMESSGAALEIGQWTVGKLGRERAILAVVLSCAVLTYGGVSLFVVAFAVYPVASAVFATAGLPSRLIPGTIALGAFTFTMTALPGTPALQNAIPMPFFGTTPFAAPGLGLVAAAVMMAIGYFWLTYRAKGAAAEGVSAVPDKPAPDLRELRDRSQGEGFDVTELGADTVAEDAGPGIVVAVAPIVLVVLLNFLFSKLVFPNMDLSWLAEPGWGGVTLADVNGIWSITASLTVACVAVLALNYRHFSTLLPALSDGANASVGPIFNTAALVGFGAVIAMLPAFLSLSEAIVSIAPNNPLISLSIAVSVLAGITGSASGGMSIALETLGQHYLEMGAAAGISPEVLHRITTVATGGLDSLPHNGAVITLLAICGKTHRDSYADIFVVAVLGPLVALVTIVFLASVF